MACLEDVKDKIVTLERPEESAPWPPASSSAFSPFGAIPEPPLPDVAVLPGRLEDLGPEQRERVLSHLLERLHAFTKSQQLEAATAMGGGGGGLTRLSPQQQARRSGAGMGSPSGGLGLSLPKITSIPRRNAAASLPISQSVVSAAQEAASSSLMGMGRAARSAEFPSHQQGAASPSGQLQEATASSPGGGEADSPGGGGDAHGGMPAVDDLLSRVMSEVRPWGKRSQELGLTASRQGVFLRKGAKGTVR